jgi:hypothetical protein
MFSVGRYYNFIFSWIACTDLLGFTTAVSGEKLYAI